MLKIMLQNALYVQYLCKTVRLAVLKQYAHHVHQSHLFLIQLQVHANALQILTLSLQTIFVHLIQDAYMHNYLQT